MLEGITIVLHVVVVVVGVGKEIIVVAEDVLVRELGLRQAHLGRHSHLVDFLGVVAQGLADLVA